MALAHIPLKETLNRNPPLAEAIVDHDSDDVLNPGSDTTRNDSESLLNDADTVTTDHNCFGVYCVYARKPIYDPLECPSPNAHALLPGASGSVSRPRTGPNQGPFHPDLETMVPYYHPFSNPSAVAMIVAHYLGGSVQSLRKTSEIAHILEHLYSDLSPLDLCKFDTAVENRKLDAYLISTSESMFHHEDGWQESSVRI